MSSSRKRRVNVVLKIDQRSVDLMPYVKKNANKEVTAVSVEASVDCPIWVEDSDPALRAFLSQWTDNSALDDSDLEFIRVLEDLLDVLMDKRVFLFTELPEEAQAKLLNRQALRAKRRGALNLLED